MGLNTSHGCWDGAYSVFMQFRQRLAFAAGIPLAIMRGFYSGGETVADCGRRWPLPVLEWESLKPRPLHILLNHSDCEGEIAVADLIPLADDMESVLPLLSDSPEGRDTRDDAEKFIAGLRRAAEANEPVDFH